MNDETTMARSARPAHIGRTLLMRALSHLQLVPPSNLDMAIVTESISKVVGSLFASQSLELRNPTHVALVSHAMDELRNTHQLLSAATVRCEALVEAKKTIAKTLAVLYPVAQIKTYRRKRKGKIQATLLGEEGPLSKRSLPRGHLETHVGIQSEEFFYTGVTNNISLTGLYIATFSTRPIGSPINVNFNLPNGHFVSSDGLVQWVKPEIANAHGAIPGIGVLFETIQPQDLLQIERYLKPGNSQVQGYAVQ